MISKDNMVMESLREKEEFFNKARIIPYSIVLDSLKSMLRSISVEYGDENIFPDNIVISLSTVDRKSRAKVEDVFIEELTRDVIRYIKVDFSVDVTKIQLQIKSDNRLLPFHFRLQGYSGDKLLYSRTREEEDIEVKDEKSEWDASDIYNDDNDSGRSILVVDDEPVLCAILDKMLSRLGYHVVSAHNGIEAMKILGRMNIDLVISDLRMPQMDGWMLMKHSKEKYPDIPFVLITGYHSIHTENRASHSSADGYLSKPFSLHQIKSLLENVLSRKDDTNTTVTYIPE